MSKLSRTLAVFMLMAAVSAQAAAPGAPRIQPSVPAGFKEIPYTEKRPLPEFNDTEKTFGFMLFSRSIMQPVYKVSIPRASERIEDVSAFAAQGEYEPVTFSIYPLRDIKNMRVQVSDLRSGENVIGQKDLDLRLVTEWKIRYPNYSSKDTYQQMPELLEAVTVNSFSKGECQRYWLKVHVPQAAGPGIYTGCFTISDDAAQKTVLLPIKLRVLGYKLLQDPAKRYSVYYYQNDQLLREMPDELLKQALKNDYASMREYGIDTIPTMTVSTRKGKDGALEVYIPRPEAIDTMLSLGFTGPIPLIGGIPEFYRKHVPGGKIGSHWAIDKLPANDAVYQEIEEAFRKLRLECEAKGWPELICCPLDEVAPSSADFSAKVFAAIRKSGMKTYITKDPMAADAVVYRKLDAVDAWCSQPFAMPYEKIIADKRYEYWSYPNHVAGEIKDRVTMQKGGRMTYGFGFWRSGYTLLVPWMWRWTTCKADQFDYLRGSHSGCGNRIDEQGNIIPAVYWECFREGKDDLRYLYTLQQAVYERKNAQDPACRALVSQGQALIRHLWDSIVPREKYLSSNMWTDEQFTVARWQLADLTDKLLKFPAANKGIAPSVMADTSKPAAVKADIFAIAAKDGVLERFDLDGGNFSKWRPVNKEVTAQVIKSTDLSPERRVLSMTVNVDHKLDGGGEDGRYPVGWPRIRREFTPDELNLNDYDYLTFNVKIDSDRDEVADDFTPFAVNFSSYEGSKYDLSMDLGDRQRTWLPVRVSVTDIIKNSNCDRQKWNHLKGLQLVIAEAKYKDGTRLQFDLDQIALVKVKHPVIEDVECADTVLLPAKYLPVGVTGMGMSGSVLNDGYQLVVKLSDKSGKMLTSKTAGLNPEDNVVLNIEGIAAGQYRLDAMITDKTGKTVSSRNKNIEATAGFLN
jgi:hypothetical protein